MRHDWFLSCENIFWVGVGTFWTDSKALVLSDTINAKLWSFSNAALMKVWDYKSTLITRHETTTQVVFTTKNIVTATSYRSNSGWDLHKSTTFLLVNNYLISEVHRGLIKPMQTNCGSFRIIENAIGDRSCVRKYFRQNYKLKIRSIRNPRWMNVTNDSFICILSDWIRMCIVTRTMQIITKKTRNSKCTWEMKTRTEISVDSDDKNVRFWTQVALRYRRHNFQVNSTPLSRWWIWRQSIISKIGVTRQLTQSRYVDRYWQCLS